MRTRTALLAVSTVSTFLLLSACERETRPTERRGPPADVGPVEPTPTPALSPTPTPEPGPSATPLDATPTPTPAGATGTIPYGVPVPGKPGFVTSPFSNAGYVDVRGFPPNSEVKDPYSGRTFLVP